VMGEENACVIGFNCGVEKILALKWPLMCFITCQMLRACISLQVDYFLKVEVMHFSINKAKLITRSNQGCFLCHNDDFGWVHYFSRLCWITWPQICQLKNSLN
jgi:hypothetical protein